MLERIKITLQNIQIKRWLTELAGWSAEWRGGWLTRWIIILFVRVYKVDMQEAQEPNVASYQTFNEFFMRSLREDARPIDSSPAGLVFPADGIILQFGEIKEGQLLQAKGQYYSLEALLVGNESMIAPFRNGIFVTTYLAPRDYHRVHMPCNGVLREMLYVPGELFSVNPMHSLNIPNLFTRNERIICLFDTSFGPMIQILVGAIIVGSIETVWERSITSPREGIIKCWSYPPANDKAEVILLKGQEMGRFKLGSTVINLFVKKNVLLGEHLYTLCMTRVGQRLAQGIVIAKTESSVNGITDS